MNIRHSDPAIAAARGRWAVATMFLVNGFLVGSWAPQIPLVLTRLEITEFTLGLLILCFGLGALSSMPWSGYLMAEHGTRKVLRVFAAIATLGLTAVALAPNVWLAGLALWLFGAVAGTMDVAMNANAVVVEQKLARPIMSSSHGFWSLGGFAGGGAGGIVIQNFGHLQHAVLVMVIASAAVAFASSRLIAEDRPVGHAHTKFSLPRSATAPGRADRAAQHRPRGRGARLGCALPPARARHRPRRRGLRVRGFLRRHGDHGFLGDVVRNVRRRPDVPDIERDRGGEHARRRPDGRVAIAPSRAAGSASPRWCRSRPGRRQSARDPVRDRHGDRHHHGYSRLLLAPSAIGFAAERTGFGPFIALSGLLVVACRWRRSCAPPISRRVRTRLLRPTETVPRGAGIR